MAEASHERRPARRVVAFTKRQLAIIDLIAEGWTDKQIAYSVGMAYRTVRTHLERLYELNGVHCRAALVASVVQTRQLSQQHQAVSDGERHPSHQRHTAADDKARPTRAWVATNTPIRRHHKTETTDSQKPSDGPEFQLHS